MGLGASWRDPGRILGRGSSWWGGLWGGSMGFGMFLGDFWVNWGAQEESWGPAGGSAPPHPSSSPPSDATQLQALGGLGPPGRPPLGTPVPQPPGQPREWGHCERFRGLGGGSGSRGGTKGFEEGARGFWGGSEELEALRGLRGPRSSGGGLGGLWRVLGGVPGAPGPQGLRDLGVGGASSTLGGSSQFWGSQSPPLPHRTLTDPDGALG